MNDPVLRTERLALRKFRLDDSGFVLRLLNEPSFKKYIGDRGVSTVDDAVDYIEKGPLANYQKYGYGVLVMEQLEDGEPAGMCGLFRRDNLDHPDLGFAMLEQYFGRGYATEASRGVIHWAQMSLRLPLIAAVVNEDNLRSRSLIEKLGFRFEGLYRMPGEDDDLRYYALRLDEA